MRSNKIIVCSTVSLGKRYQILITNPQQRSLSQNHKHANLIETRLILQFNSNRFYGKRNRIN